MMNKRRISILLMVVTIATIVLFQAYWLRKNYLEENRLLTLRTNLLFRETLFRLQATKLHLDTTAIPRMPMPEVMGAVSTVNVMHERIVMDSGRRTAHPDSVFITMRRDPLDRGDSANELMVRREGPSKVTAFLLKFDSLQEPVSIKEMHDKFRTVLKKEGIHVSFVIDTTSADIKKDRTFTRDDDGNVVLGFAKPIIYRVHLENTYWIIAKRVGPQLLFSLVLVGVTILSFLLLYRNWRQQQKLTILKNDFISNITHELKTPIATVSVAVEALKEFDALKDPVRTREYLEISTHELQRLSLLVDKVLKLSLFEKQEIELKKDDFDMKVLVEDVMKSMRLQFEKYRASVRLWAGPNDAGIRVVGPGRNGPAGEDASGMEVDGEEGGMKTGTEDNLENEGKPKIGAGRVPPTANDAARFRLRADKLHFTSVLYNLLDNALKYSRETPHVTINLHGDVDFIQLTVMDNGIGIPADYKDRIFEKFFRVPMGDHHNVKGYGLGLSYVAYVVQRHGGEIKVRSKEGFGSIFTIKIPRDHV